MGCIDKNMIYLCILFIGIKISSGILHSEQSAPPARVQQCREGCLQKFATEDFACLQEPECSMVCPNAAIFLAIQMNAFCDICWDQCADTSSLNSSIANSWTLQNTSLIRDGSLVSTDVTWKPLKDPTQCLVTWEVSGGGLMGNLLTDSTTVQLSLWPDTIYRVQVTCKNKKTEAITRSLPLTLDTSHAYVKLDIESTSPSSSTVKQLYRSTQLLPVSKLVNYRKGSSSSISSSSSSSSNSNSNKYSNKKTTTIIKNTGGEEQQQQEARDSNTNDNNYYYTYHPQNMQIINKKLFESSSLFYKNRFEIILGFSAAILVFSIILVIFILYNLKKSSRKSIPAALATSKYDKQLLIDDDDNEFLNNHTVHV